VIEEPVIEEPVEEPVKVEDQKRGFFNWFIDGGRPDVVAEKKRRLEVDKEKEPEKKG